MNAEITVVIPSYNPGSFLIKALKSVYEQTLSNWRLILVDDCSTDGSLVRAKLLLNDPRIKVVRNKVNLGQSKAQNIALKLVKTPYFVQLDSDDWFMPYTLEVLLNEFKRQPKEVAVVSGNSIMIDEKTSYLKINNNKPGTAILKGQFFKDKYDFLLANKSVWPRCYRTSVVKKVGGWPTDDPYHGRHMEDKIMLYRLIENYRFYWIDKVLYVYRKHDNNSTNNLKVYNDTLEWSVRHTLKRWGNEYRPIFGMRYGWKAVVRLVRN